MIIVLFAILVKLKHIMAEYPINVISFNINSAGKDYCVPPHRHNFWQFYYLKDGDVEMTVSENKFCLTNGNSILIPPRVIRSPKCIGKPPYYMFVLFKNICLDIDGMREKVLHAQSEQQDQAQKIFDEIKMPKDMNSSYLLTSTLINLLIELRRMLEQKQTFSEEYYDEIVSKVDMYMRSNLHLPLRRKDIAHIAHVSPPHLARIFHHVLGMPPLKRLTQLRMQHAKFLLSQSTQPITTISANVGYESISHFSRLFRKHSDKSPRQFRKEFFENLT